MITEHPKTTELAEAPPTLPSVAIQAAAADAETFCDREPRRLDLARL